MGPMRAIDRGGGTSMRMLMVGLNHAAAAAGIAATGTFDDDVAFMMIRT